MPLEISGSFVWVLMALYCLAVGGAFSALVLSSFEKFSRLKPKRPFFWRLFGGLAFTYLALLAETFINPYWEDNGAVSRIIFPEHFGWALFGSAVYQFIGVPLFFGLVALLSIFRAKTGVAGK